MPSHIAPHMSEMLRDQLELSSNVFTLDVNLGCTGYVKPLMIINSLMKDYKFKQGILLTIAQTRKSIQDNDKDTNLIFGDTASATLISDDTNYKFNSFNFGSNSKKDSFKAIIGNTGKHFTMDGRGVYEFVLKNIPPAIREISENNEIDYYIFHQASKVIVEQLAKRLKIEENQYSFNTKMPGNSGATTIPYNLKKIIENKQYKKILLSSFGSGLEWANCILERVDNE